MKKLRLEIEHLEVESFEPVAAAEGGRGTVHGREATAATGCATACEESCSCVGEEYTPFIASCSPQDCATVVANTCDGLCTGFCAEASSVCG